MTRKTILKCIFIQALFTLLVQAFKLELIYVIAHFELYSNTSEAFTIENFKISTFMYMFTWVHFGKCVIKKTKLKNKNIRHVKTEWIFLHKARKDLVKLGVLFLTLGPIQTNISLQSMIASKNLREVLNIMENLWFRFFFKNGIFLLKIFFCVAGQLSWFLLDVAWP